MAYEWTCGGLHSQALWCPLVLWAWTPQPHCAVTTQVRARRTALDATKWTCNAAFTAHLHCCNLRLQFLLFLLLAHELSAGGLKCRQRRKLVGLCTALLLLHLHRALQQTAFSPALHLLTLLLNDALA